jgi:hypothetical protein
MAKTKRDLRAVGLDLEAATLDETIVQAASYDPNARKRLRYESNVRRRPGARPDGQIRQLSHPGPADLQCAARPRPAGVGLASAIAPARKRGRPRWRPGPHSGARVRVPS